MLAARHAGVQPEAALNAVQSFRNTKRRQEVLFDRAGITVVDDFAHHPTAIEVTLAGLRDQYPGRRLVLVLEPRSNTMRMGVHADALANATRLADERFWLTSPQLRWELTPERARGLVFPDSDTLLSGLLQHLMPGDVIVCMSNGDFQGFKPKLLRALEEHYV
jgi:UDP-N-acetylmuramate: L-alanyl-gamma-D-glutamyl-meso-diaminopimelate ligase